MTIVTIVTVLLDGVSFGDRDGPRAVGSRLKDDVDSHRPEERGGSSFSVVDDCRASRPRATVRPLELWADYGHPTGYKSALMG